MQGSERSQTIRSGDNSPVLVDALGRLIAASRECRGSWTFDFTWSRDHPQEVIDLHGQAYRDESVQATPEVEPPLPSFTNLALLMSGPSCASCGCWCERWLFDARFQSPAPGQQSPRRTSYFSCGETCPAAVVCGAAVVAEPCAVGVFLLFHLVPGCVGCVESLVV